MTNRHAPTRIVLIGMPGSGKSAVARLLARRLGSRWSQVDLDEQIAARDGRSIPRIFRESGEPAFRELERHAISHYDDARCVVLATGGGAILDPVNRRHLWQQSFVLYLKARPQTLLKRVGGQGRPLLDGHDPAVRLPQLLAERASLYELADWTLQTDALFPDQVAEEVVHAYERFAEQLVARSGRDMSWQVTEAAPEGASSTANPADGAGGPAAIVQAPSGSYPIYTGSGELPLLGERMRATGLKGSATLVADETVFALFGEAALSSLRSAGFACDAITISGGEQDKHLGTVERIYDRLIERRHERGDAIVALGGGVTTDLAGYVAATYLRGVPLVQVPTSLLGMVDAAIGGKVGVDHRLGKNLIGAFYQPRLVVADTDTLQTLLPRELTAGWAEVIKHALILDPELLETLTRDAERVQRLDPAALVPVLRRSARIKAGVVSGDERESGARMTLNYGHTIGHAIEAATGYATVLHGEAVAVGMAGAAQIARQLGVLSEEVAEQQRRVLEQYDLPQRRPGVNVEAVLEALTRDKKVAAKQQRWVLLRAIGRTVIRDDVPAELVREVVAGLLAP